MPRTKQMPSRVPMAALFRKESRATERISDEVIHLPPALQWEVLQCFLFNETSDFCLLKL